MTKKFGHKIWPREIVHFRRQVDAEAVLKLGACDSPIEAKETTHKKLNAVVLRAFMTRPPDDRISAPGTGVEGASKSPSVWFPDLTPKVLDEAGKVRSVWRDAIKPFSIFQSGANVSGIAVERHEGKQDVAIVRMPCQAFP